MQCHAFIEHYYSKLMKYALKLEKGNEEKAEDMLHSTILLLLEGRENVDFKKAPLAYFFQMLRRERNRATRYKQRGFENSYVYENNTVESHDDMATLAEVHAHDIWMASEREENEFELLLDHFDELTADLTPLQRAYIEGSMDGLSYEEIAANHNTAVGNIKCVMVRARKAIKEKAQALLLDAQTSGQVS